jgi:hypothetical protein
MSVASDGGSPGARTVTWAAVEARDAREPEEARADSHRDGSMDRRVVV